MKKQAVWFMMSFVFLLAACAPKEEQKTNQPLEPIEASMDLPEKAGLNEKVTISTKVTQGGEPIDDADEVKYEIWKDGSKENSEMLEAVFEEDGVYTVKKTFNEEAVYYVQVHVTARNLHTMPKSAISIGNAVVPADMKDESMDHDMESMDH